MAKYIIFLDGELKGYLNDESSTRRAVSDLADNLIEELKQLPASQKMRIFRENVEFGIKIYSQTTGGYIFDGLVTLQHTINWKPLPEYREKHDQ
jgi:hypothetical protein